LSFLGCSAQSCRKLPKVVGATKRIRVPHHLTDVQQQARRKIICICRSCGIVKVEWPIVLFRHLHVLLQAGCRAITL
jgi:hypothetical protein